MTKQTTHVYLCQYGYYDIKPGITFAEDTVVKYGDKIVMRTNNRRKPFNEIQIQVGECVSDMNCRAPALLGVGDPLFLHDPDYDAKRLIRLFWTTKDFPVGTNPELIVKCQGVTLCDHLQDDTPHPLHDGWGGAQTLEVKKEVLPLLDCPDEVKTKLNSKRSVKSFNAILSDWIKSESGYVSFIV